MKRSTGKATLPGTKQVYRVEREGVLEHDIIALATEPVIEGRPLLERVMRDGRRLGSSPPLSALRERAATSVASLPGPLRALDGPQATHPVQISAGIEALIEHASPG